MVEQQAQEDIQQKMEKNINQREVSQAKRLKNAYERMLLFEK